MYTQISPSSWSAHYIDAFWMQTNLQNSTVKTTILPDGCSDILFSFNNSSCNSFAVGCMTRPVSVTISPGEIIFGIRFKPGCARPFLNIPLKDITDTTASLEQIRKVDLSSLEPDDISFQAGFINNIIEPELKKLFLARAFDAASFRTAEYIKQTGGTKPVNSVAAFLGISKRHLERKFIDSVGISPKLFSRIMRFQYARNILKSKKDTYHLSSLALDSGYFDQAHFCKEFKEFSGSTPLNA